MSGKYSAYSTLVTILIFIFVLLVSFGRACSVGTGNMTEITATVTEKGIKRYSSDTDKYLIYTKTDDGKVEVFEVTDSVLAARFNSSDVYAGIEIGKKYKFSVRGSRVPIFSWYPNIYEYSEVKND